MHGEEDHFLKKYILFEGKKSRHAREYNIKVNLKTSVLVYAMNSSVSEQVPFAKCCKTFTEYQSFFDQQMHTLLT
jgi:hypothetical protein